MRSTNVAARSLAAVAGAIRVEVEVTYRRISDFASRLSRFEPELYHVREDGTSPITTPPTSSTSQARSAW